MSRKALLTTVAVVVLGAFAWVFARQLWQAVLRLHGHMVRLETKSLEADDCVSLMKSITPERNQQELQERGGTDFGFAFGEQARFRVAVFKQRGRIGMVLRRIQAAP
jgi:Tfp pilus assembly pilus retraction ATPase PilT